MKLKWMVPLLVLLVGLAVWVHLANGPERRKAPPSLTAEQILAAPENQVFSLITSDLRWKVAELDAADFGLWRTLPAPARHVLALSWLEQDEGPGTPPLFTGFANLVANTAPNMATLAEIAEAYEAIGAPTAAAVVTQAAQLAAASGNTPADGVTQRSDPFNALNRQLCLESSKAKCIKLIRAYIRTNAEEIAGAAIKN